MWIIYTQSKAESLYYHKAVHIPINTTHNRVVISHKRSKLVGAVFINASRHLYLNQLLGTSVVVSFLSSNMQMQPEIRSRDVKDYCVYYAPNVSVNLWVLKSLWVKAHVCTYTAKYRSLELKPQGQLRYSRASQM